MIINSSNLTILNRGFKAAFQRSFDGAQVMWPKIATRVPSSTLTEDYGWIGDMPGMREWVGDRVIKNLAQHDYSIKNKKFVTVGVDRDKLEDDQYGIYTPMFEMLGHEARIHPDKLIFALLASGFSTGCYDGQYFFDSDHPVLDQNGVAQSVSNVQTGAGNPWYLLDTTRPLKPLIYQERKPPKFVYLNKEDDQNVFFSDKFVYGADYRGNVGFGFWQMAYGSKDTLDETNFNAAWAAMGSLKKDHGEPAGIVPNLLVVGPSNRSAAKTVIEMERNAAGASNINYKAVEILVCPWLA